MGKSQLEVFSGVVLTRIIMLLELGLELELELELEVPCNADLSALSPLLPVFLK